MARSRKQTIVTDPIASTDRYRVVGFLHPNGSIEIVIIPSQGYTATALSTDRLPARFGQMVRQHVPEDALDAVVSWIDQQPVAAKVVPGGTGPMPLTPEIRRQLGLDKSRGPRR